MTGICTLKLRLHGVQSLKEKRSILRKILDRVRKKYNVSIGEIDSQDIWQEAIITFAYVTNDVKMVERVMEKVERIVEQECEILEKDLEIIR